MAEDKCFFRFDRGLLSESLETSVEISSIEDLFNVLKASDPLCNNLTTDDIEIKYYCYDGRIPQHCYAVAICDGVIGGFLTRDIRSKKRPVLGYGKARQIIGTISRCEISDINKQYLEELDWFIRNQEIKIRKGEKQ